MARKRKKIRGGGIGLSAGIADSPREFVGANSSAAFYEGNSAVGEGALLNYFPPERRPFSLESFLIAAKKPPLLIKREWKSELPHLAFVFLLVFALYCYTAPRLVALEDDGLFLMNMKFFGVAHPPGYPLHTLLGGLFWRIFFWGEPALRGHLFSGFAAAVACSAIYAITAMLLRGRIFAYAAGVAYGCSQTFWSQAIITEVYALNAMMFFIVFALCLKYASHRGVKRDSGHFRLFCVIALVYGLGLANHWPLMGLGSIGLAIIVASQTGSIIRRIPAGALFLTIGLLPYAWLVFRSHSGTIASFYGPIETLDQFLFYVLRKGYAGVDKQSNVGLDDKIAFSLSLLRQMAWQFTPIGAAFSAVGFAVMARSRHQWVWLGMLVSWFMSGFLLVIMIDFKAEYIWFSAFRVYPLLAYGLMAIWLALGMAWCADRLRLSPTVRGPICGMAVAALAAASIGLHWGENNRRDYRWAHDFASFKLLSLEPNAVLFTFDDLDVPVGYLHFVEEVRPDLIVFNDQGLVFGNRLYSPLTSDDRKRGILTEYVRKVQRPIYYHPLRTTLFGNPKFGSDFLGFLRRVNRDGPHDRVILSDALRRWLDANLDPAMVFPDQWTRHQHFNTVATLVNAIVIASLHGFALTDEWDEVIDRAKERNILARIIANSQLLASGRMSENELRRELKWSDGVQREDYPQLGAQGFGHFYLLRANITYALDPNGNGEKYRDNLKTALQVFPESDNPALRPLLAYYYQKNDDDSFLSLMRQFFPKAEDIPKDLLRLQRQVRRRAG